jgi:hypothetical protein
MWFLLLVGNDDFRRFDKRVCRHVDKRRDGMETVLICRFKFG